MMCFLSKCSGAVVERIGTKHVLNRCHASPALKILFTAFWLLSSHVTLRLCFVEVATHGTRSVDGTGDIFMRKSVLWGSSIIFALTKLRTVERWKNEDLQVDVCSTTQHKYIKYFGFYYDCFIWIDYVKKYKLYIKWKYKLYIKCIDEMYWLRYD